MSFFENEFIDLLKRPYSESQKGAEVGDFSTAVGLPFKNIRALVDRVLAGLDEEKFGIQFLAANPALGEKRRILISDYIYQCVSSIEENLVEGLLHLKQLRYHHFEQVAWVAPGIILRKEGCVDFKPQPRQTPLDDLHLYMFGLSVAGLVRAMGSTLDCIGIGIIGVMGLSTDLTWGTFGRAKDLLKKTTETPSSETAKWQAKFFADLTDCLRKSGPEDWDTWLDGLRNLYVHRGRRLHINQIKPDITVDKAGNPTLNKVDVVSQLPRDPRWSEVEAFLDKGRTPILTESTLETLSFIFSSTLEFAERVAPLLVEKLNEREKSPKLVMQPIKQWQDIQTNPSKFVGYKPGSVEYVPKKMISTPQMTKRLFAASLMDHAIKNWETFK